MRVYGSAVWGLDEVEAKKQIEDEFASELVHEYELLAYFSSEPDYEMGCWILLRRGQQLFVVEGGHCSCYGYEGQFEPAEVNVGYLGMLKGGYGRPSAKQLSELIAELQG